VAAFFHILYRRLAQSLEGLALTCPEPRGSLEGLVLPALTCPDLSPIGEERRSLPKGVSKGILRAFRSPEAFWGSNVRNLNTCAKRTRNSRRISTSILKDLNMPGISTYTKIINAAVCSSGRTAHLFSSGGPEVFHLAGRSRAPLSERCRHEVASSRESHPPFRLADQELRALTKSTEGSAFRPIPAISLQSALLKQRTLSRLK
jgi:hypothetical protein